MSRVAVLILLLSVGALPPTSTQADVASTFDVNADGWSVRSFSADLCVVSSDFPVDFSSGGGNPGGCVFAIDPDDAWFVFNAPSKFLGDIGWAYEGSIAFDRLAEPGPLDDGAFDVILSGAGLLLKYDTQPPQTAWTRETVGLVEGPGWTACNGSSPTATEFLSVLHDLDGLYVLGEYRSGVECCWLDNVVLAASSTSSLDRDLSFPSTRVSVTMQRPYTIGSPILLSGLLPGRPLDVSVYSITGSYVTTVLSGTPTTSTVECRWDGSPRHGALPCAVYYLVARVPESCRLSSSKIVVLR
jgi:hypothetical protein